jgi:hypothetical protein
LEGLNIFEELDERLYRRTMPSSEVTIQGDGVVLHVYLCAREARK